MNQNNRSFSERMIAAKAANRGVSCHKSHKVTRPKETFGLDALERYLNQWRKDQEYYAHLAVEMALFPHEFVEF
jgi:hypothetical protein